MSHSGSRPTHDLAGLPELDNVDHLLGEHDGEAKYGRDERDREVGDKAVDGGQQLGLVEKDARREEGRDSMSRQAERGRIEVEEVESDEEGLIREAEDKEHALRRWSGRDQSVNT